MLCFLVCHALESGLRAHVRGLIFTIVVDWSVETSAEQLILSLVSLPSSLNSENSKHYALTR